jgi:hypothetical protein
MSATERVVAKSPDYFQPQGKVREQIENRGRIGNRSREALSARIPPQSNTINAGSASRES